jgi:hypothetical protein
LRLFALIIFLIIISPKLQASFIGVGLALLFTGFLARRHRMQRSEAHI